MRSLLILKSAKALQNHINQVQQDAKNAAQKVEDDNPELFECDETIGLNNGGVANNTVANGRVANGRAAKFNHKFFASDSSADPSCTLPEEEQAQEAQQEVEALNESGEASQEALEAAEEAAEAAEASAEAAETALEAAADGLDVLEGILDLVAVF